MSAWTSRQRRKQLTVDREPQEDGAGFEATGDLVDPLVIKGHPARTALALEVARLGLFPEVGSAEVLPSPDGVEREATLEGETPDAEGLTEDRALRWGLGVRVAADVQNEGAQAKEHGREHVREPVADVLLGVRHADLTNESTDVDKEIEILREQMSIRSPWLRTNLAYHVDTRGGECGIDNDALTTLLCADEQFGATVLLSDKR